MTVTSHRAEPVRRVDLTPLWTTAAHAAAAALRWAWTVVRAALRWACAAADAGAGLVLWLLGFAAVQVAGVVALAAAAGIAVWLAGGFGGVVDDPLESGPARMGGVGTGETGLCSTSTGGRCAIREDLVYVPAGRNGRPVTERPREIR